MSGGTRPGPNSRTRAPRFARKLLRYRNSASFAISAGWKLNAPPIDTHRRAPPAIRPTWGKRTTMTARTARHSNGRAHRRSLA